jgi:hypothetical protein
MLSGSFIFHAPHRPTPRNPVATQRVMIDVQQAVKSAERYARSLYPEAELRHLRLEEVRRSDDGRQWDITLGWVEPHAGGNWIAFTATVQRVPRIYKLFEVDAETGEVRAMKIRDVA